MTGLRAELQRLAEAARATASRPAPGTPHAGSFGLPVDVVELVNWVYADQRAHEVDGRGIGLHEGERVAEGLLRTEEAGGGNPFIKFAEVMILGVRVDRQGYDIGDLHPVAEAVNELVMAMPLPAAKLIVHFAERREVPSGARFDIKLGPSWKVEPRYDIGQCSACGQFHALPKSSAFYVVYDRNRNAQYCPLEFDYGPDFMAKLRAEYVAWHDALAELVGYCDRDRKRLGGLVVTGPSLQRTPWL